MIVDLVWTKSYDWDFHALPSIELLEYLAHLKDWIYTAFKTTFKIDRIDRSASLQQALLFLIYGHSYLLHAVKYDISELIDFIIIRFFSGWDHHFIARARQDATLSEQVRINKELQELCRYLIDKATEPRELASRLYHS